MTGLAIAALMLYGYAQYVQKSAPTLICVIAACTALCNQFVQGVLGGSLGVALSLLLSGVATVLVAQRGGK